MHNVNITTIYGYKTKKPIVEMRFPKRRSDPARLVQLSIEEARDLALNLLQAAESAVQDAFLVEFFKGLEIDDNEIGAMLAQYRLMRADRQSDLTG